MMEYLTGKHSNDEQNKVEVKYLSASPVHKISILDKHTVKESSKYIASFITPASSGPEVLNLSLSLRKAQKQTLHLNVTFICDSQILHKCCRPG